LTERPHQFADLRGDVIRVQYLERMNDNHQFAFAMFAEVCRANNRQEAKIDFLVGWNDGKGTLAVEEVVNLFRVLAEQGFIDHVDHFGDGVLLVGLFRQGERSGRPLSVYGFACRLREPRENVRPRLLFLGELDGLRRLFLLDGSRFRDGRRPCVDQRDHQHAEEKES
jgi:hypothetical protein